MGFFVQKCVWIRFNRYLAIAYVTMAEMGIACELHLVVVAGNTPRLASDGWFVSVSRVSDKVRIEFAGKEQTIYVLFEDGNFTLRRTGTRREIFSGASIWMAPRFTNDQQLKLRIIIDKSSIEMYAHDGLSSLNFMHVCSRLYVVSFLSVFISHIRSFFTRVYEVEKRRIALIYVTNIIFLWF